MYLLTKLDCWYNNSLFIGISLLIITSVIALFVLIIGGVEFDEDKGERIRLLANITKLKILFTISAICIGISIVLPTTKQAAFIYIAPQIIENGAVKDTVKNIPELTKLGTDYLKELLQEKINEQ